MGINGHTGFENKGVHPSQGALQPVDVVHQTGGRVVNVFSVCASCGESCKGLLCDFCERDIKRGGYPDYFKGQTPGKKYFLDTPLFLNGQNYKQSHSVSGFEYTENSEVYLLGIEEYDNFLVCILSVNREIPWVHKGRKLGSDGKRNGEQTFTPKISRKEKVYRVACDPKNLVEQEMVVYSGLIRNGKLIPDTEINYSSLLQIVGSIIKIIKI